MAGIQSTRLRFAELKIHSTEVGWARIYSAEVGPLSIRLAEVGWLPTYSAEVCEVSNPPG